ncbi:hypothetical protein FRD01_07635 [Microvenator marinus]|jgi:hypothetical protein|uniref:Uncharacterized protein n=1 Tax=Microvenator marinus TaxID=2600177 RepID=A0A5B8XN89_9DELT|nr:hypothetical protein [Microvenator marinus]QED27114.1 hypothetical protein FRD01_07635 [Microvenator marinus]
MKTFSTLKVFGKLGLAGAIIAGVAGVMLVTQPDGEVSEAEADIATFTTTKALYDEDFAKVVESSGLKPKPYELNGQLVYFAVNYTERSPTEILEAYQKRFVEAGINKKEFLEVPEGKYKRTLDDFASLDPKRINLNEDELDYNEAILNGGVVPLERREGYVAMGGMVPKDDRHDSLEELFADWQIDQIDRLGTKMGAWRFIDAQALGPNYTRVTSMWSGDNTNFEAMGNPQKAGVNPIMETPVCMGCSVGSQMKSLDKSHRYRIGHFYGGRSTDDLVGFYETAMRSRGFELSDGSKAVEFARAYIGGVPEGKIMSFSREGLDAFIAIAPDTKLGETSVTVVEAF